MNPGQPGMLGKGPKAAPDGTKNPYIVNFCRALVDKKGEKLEPAALQKLLNDMYGLYENLLGQNMVKALPPELRQKYLAICEDLSQLDYATIGEIFDKYIPDYQTIMKDTMRQFAEIFLKNRELRAEDYGVPKDALRSAAAAASSRDGRA